VISRLRILMSEPSCFTVPGLIAPAELRIDPWGIAHIKAESRSDLFFAQGLNAARDRLWQLDIWRKRGLGLMATDFGAGFLAQDRACRLFLYRGDMQAEWAAYSCTDAQSITESFVAGLNAWIGLTEQNPDLLPPEFTATDTRPARWEAADVVRIRSHALVRNVLSEVARARILAHADLATDAARQGISPPYQVIIPEGVDYAAIPDDVLDVFKLASAVPDFSPARMQAPLADAWRWTRVTEQGDVLEQGSNNWAISATRSETGRPIMASDPHRAHSLPSLRHIVHLTCPDLDVIGAGEPALPGISIGHNGHAAFSLTIFRIDQEDLVVLETDPADPDRYRWQGGWRRMEVVEEMVPVRGQADQRVVLKFTELGAIVKEVQDAHGARAYVVRSVWFTPGASAYFNALAYLDVRTPEQFQASLGGWATPSVNHVYADVNNRLGWFAAGRAPIRPNWDGLLPVPGDGQYEWAGFHAASVLPSKIDPPEGIIATANEMNLPEGYDAEGTRLGFEWAEASRAARIFEVLRAQNNHGIADSQALQTDTISLPARRLCALLGDLPGEAAALLRDWDHRLSRESGAAALHEIWWMRHLKPAVFDRLTADPVVRALLPPGDADELIPLLETGDARLGDIPALFATTLSAAWGDCAKLLGDDPAQWAWGKLHHGAFPHPLGRISDLPGVARLPKGGSGSTVMNASYRLSDFRVTMGASFRMVFDVGNWDNSRTINAPGQSGDPRSPHYGDLAPLWAAGSYVPMLYSDAAVEAVTEQRIRLLPG